MLDESDKIAEGTDLRLCFEAEADLLEEQCQAKAREKMVAVMDDEFKKVDGVGKKDLPDLGGEKSVGREADSGEGRFPGKLYQLRYTKAEITTFSKVNYEEMEIMDEEEVEEREGGLNTVEKTNADNQETINQKELDTAREREEQTLLYNVEYAGEFEALISQYEDQLDDNVKLSLKLEEAKFSVRGELAEYHIRALNEEISDIKCNIRALNELLLKREVDLDTVRTNLVVSEVDFEKLSSSIMGKDRELHNSEQIRDSLIARLERLKADLLHLKGKEAQSRANLV
ncbi:hypothetical protein GIB67_031461 [Kingdonia uniflora]|uniref:Uncharacterized protein n=1 Tax=Kingdonia uniflora TaxID=39325 RepID=A0A7J7MBA3_9MAGN|nr:hypothetical protein GIB67_031461 [Kingdonia uniflora]